MVYFPGSYDFWNEWIPISIRFDDMILPEKRNWEIELIPSSPNIVSLVGQFSIKIDLICAELKHVLFLFVI